MLSAILLFHVYRKFDPNFYFRSRQSEAKRQNTRLIFPFVNQPGGVAHACNPATWTLGSLNGLRVGFLGAVVLCRSGVRAKFGVNREFKILRLRTTATDKHATAHDQNHVTVHFSRVVLRLR